MKKRVGVYYVTSRWPGGLMTNWDQIKNSIKRYKDLKEGPKFEHTLLPHHQCGDITKGAECATGIGRDHNINTGNGDKFWFVLAHGHHHRAHNQCRGQVVCNR